MQTDYGILMYHIYLTDVVLLLFLIFEFRPLHLHTQSEISQVKAYK